MTTINTMRVRVDGVLTDDQVEELANNIRGLLNMGVDDGRFELRNFILEVVTPATVKYIGLRPIKRRSEVTWTFK